MRFITRAFLWSFIPIGLLLIGTFLVIQTLALSTVTSNLRSSLRQTHSSVMRATLKSEAQNRRSLRIVGESAPLKAGLQLMATEAGNELARSTVEDQLREICGTLGCDFLVVSSVDGIPLSGVMRTGREVVPIDFSRLRPPQDGLFTLHNRTFQLSSASIDRGDENLGTVSVGEYFDLADFSAPAVLTRDGKVMASSIPGIALPDVEAALKSCEPRRECEVRLQHQTYLSLPMESAQVSKGYSLRSLQSVDAAIGPVKAVLNRVFLVAGLGALLTASLCSGLSSRSIVKPISSLISHLRNSETTGLLAEFQTDRVPTREIQELTDSFNRAAMAIREGRDNLHAAYVQFVESLASALDARDPYTAGHSHRVSQISCVIGRTLNIGSRELEELRVGALLHDIGKIGISDSVLQNPGRLTPEEFGVIKQHPTIGRRILESVNGFQAYLPTVELHHENWDGSGYPHALAGEATPLAARIVHIADAYDAMTSDRPYRRGMSHMVALRVVQEHAGTQFDPGIVPAFVKVAGFLHNPEPDLALSMGHLAEVVNEGKSVVPLALVKGGRT